MSKSYSFSKPLSPTGSVQFFGQTSGADTPRSLRKMGIFYENAYQAWYKTTYDGPLSWELFKGTPMVSTMSGLSLTAQFPGQLGVPSQIKAYSRLLEKFKQSDFNLGVSAGESRESWHMISDRMFKFADGVRHVRRGQLGDALRAFSSTKRPSRRAQRKLDTGDVSGSFLELSYGWVPLLSDIHAAAEVIDKPYVSKPSIRTSDGTRGAPFGATRPEFSDFVWTKDHERRVYHIVRLSEKEAGWATRLGLTDPLTIAWELVPLSFVADWFLPIGDLLSALSATYLLPVGKYVRSDVHRRYGGLLIPPGASLSSIYFSDSKTISQGSWWQKETSMTRTVYSELPSDLYLGEGPRQSLIDLDFNLFQASSAAALVHQRLKSLMGRRS